MMYRTTSSPVFSLRREIDRLFDDTFGGEGTTPRRGWLPAADVRETADGFTFELELPGVSPDQVELTADNGVLTVRGEKPPRTRKETDEGRHHFVERSYGTFVRAFQLPQGVNEEQIDAQFAHGVLTVHVPKAERPKPRRIRIAEGGEDRALGRGADASTNGTHDMNGSAANGRGAAPAAERARVEGPGTGRARETRTTREPAGASS